MRTSTLLWSAFLSTALLACEATDLGKKEVGVHGETGVPEAGLYDEGVPQRANLDGGVHVDLDAGTPEPWVIQAQLPEAVPGMELVAFCADIEPLSTPFDAEGQVALELPGGHTYTLYLFNEGSFVSSLMFPVSLETMGLSPLLVLPLDARAGLGSSSRDPAGPRSGLGSSSRVFGRQIDALEGDGVPLDLGGLLPNGAICNSENNPNALLDSDLDGIPNSEDPDADGDGVDDVLERDEDTLPSESDTLPFFPFKMHPKPEATDVPLAIVPEVWLTHPVSATSILAGRLRVMDLDEQTQVPTWVQLLDDGRHVQFLPQIPLRHEGRYALVLDAELEDDQGRMLGRSLDATFQIEGETPTGDASATALELTRLDPQHEATAVPLDVTITARFNRPVSEDGLRDHVQLLDPDGVQVEGLVLTQRSGFEVTFDPTEALSPQTTYTISLAAGLQSLGGLVLEAPEAFRFTTGDGVPNEVIEQPVDGDGDGEPDTPICTPTPELCDNMDNDCDTRVDEGFGLGAACEAGQGECLSFGVVACTPEGESACDATPRAPAAEVCNGLDDDCNGLADDALTGLDEDCVADAAGVCAQGRTRCEGAQGMICVPQATPGAFDETCDNHDEDCDGNTDEGLSQACYTGPEGTAGAGQCREGISTCAAGQWGGCEGEVRPEAELCNDADDDCDGQTDEDYPLLGELCMTGVGLCQQGGTITCTPEGEAACNAVAGAPSEELCNNFDDDCDGLVDEGSSCGTYVSRNCEVWLGQATGQDFAVRPVAEFGECMLSALDTEGQTRCTSTRRDDRFRALGVTDELQDGDHLAVAFTCSDAEQPGLAAWFQNHCALYLGASSRDAGEALDGTEAWGPCPAALAGEDGDLRCTSTGFDGQFRPMRLSGIIDYNDELAVAFICNDADYEARASGTASAVEVILGWEYLGRLNDHDGQPTWGACPQVQPPRDLPGSTLCASTQGDQQFHMINLSARSSADSELGIALRAIGAPLPETDNPGCDPHDLDLCNGEDDDCDGTIDEDFLNELGDPCSVGTGACTSDGTLVCNGDGTGVICDALRIAGSSEQCNNIDDDCDGQIDEEVADVGLDCSAGAEGNCANGSTVCEAGALACQPSAPSAETCNGFDDDCNGTVDDVANVGNACTTGANNVCQGQLMCVGASVECVVINADVTDICGDNIDNDCDGQIDEDPGCTTALQIEAGDYHTCALLDDGSVKCWGRNTSGQLGLGDTEDRGDNPNEMGDRLGTVDLGTGRTAVRVDAGGKHTCAILDDGTVKCWGNNDYGQLGNPDAIAGSGHVGDEAGEMGDALPIVPLGLRAVQVAAGLFATCALLEDGSVRCWGSNSTGALGTPNPGESVDLGVGRSATHISISRSNAHVCATLDNHTVKCWGHNAFGQLGQGDTNNRGSNAGDMGDNLPPVALGTGQSATETAAGSVFTCALLTSNSVKCFGDGRQGRLGSGDEENRGDDPGEMGDDLPFVDLGGGRNPVEISAGYYRACARFHDGAVKCWGNGIGNAPNEMGDNLPVTDLGTDLTAAQISAGHDHVCAVLNNGRVKCWGMNNAGQLGQGDRTSRTSANQLGDNLLTIDLGTAPTE
ncbi:MAG: MopE-related protein [Bradymonadia bacterium]